MNGVTLSLIIGHIIMYGLLYGATLAMPDFFYRYRFDEYSTF